MDLSQLRDLARQRPVLFLDDGGVMSDNDARRPQYVRLIGEFMPPRLGGTPKQWGAANGAIFPAVWDDIQKRMAEFTSQRAFHRAYTTSWLGRMCERVGVAMPPADEAVALYNELAVHLTQNAYAAMPGAPAAIRSLHDAGYTLYTASGTTSWELEGIVTKMGVRNAFKALYGPDLIDSVKYGAAHYERVFAHAGVPPHRALVVESDGDVCRNAVEAGASAVWVDAKGLGDALSLAEVAQALLAQ